MPQFEMTKADKTWLVSLALLVVIACGGNFDKFHKSAKELLDLTP